MWLWLTALAAASDLLIADVQLWDGTGAPVQNNVDILIQGDRIAAIGSDLVAPDGAEVLDGAGATAIPGLIDSHVHLSLDPGGAWREDTPADHAAFMDQYLRAYLACGVTTILDPAILPGEAGLARMKLANGAPGPRFLSLGTPFSPDGGYVSVVIPAFPSVGTAEEVEAQLDAQQAAGVVGIKVTFEHGMVGKIWPVHAPEIRTAIREGAKKRGLDVYVHAMSPEEQSIAVTHFGARGTMHLLEKPHKKTIELLAKHRVYEVTTLSALDSQRTAWTPERLNDPLVQLTVPAVQLATARDPEKIRSFHEFTLKTLMPRMPAKGLIRKIVFKDRTVRRRLTHMGQSLVALQKAGVPLVMGSDSGNWPVMPFEFHGPTSIREMELLGEYGLTPVQALTAATRTPAEMLKIDAGIVAVGQIADLVIVNGDPTTNLSALRDLRWTVRNGEARTPEAWMKP